MFNLILSVMDSYLSEDHSDFTFTSEENRNEDHIDRAIRTLKDLQLGNAALRKEM